MNSYFYTHPQIKICVLATVLSVCQYIFMKTMRKPDSLMLLCNIYFSNKEDICTEESVELVENNLWNNGGNDLMDVKKKKKGTLGYHFDCKRHFLSPFVII